VERKVQYKLAVLMDNIAPWWLQGGFREDKVREKLEECKRLIKGLLGELRR